MTEARARRPIWRQPLVHFLIAGAVIFALNSVRATPEPTRANKIFVSVAQVERIAGLWQKTWGRPPSETELQSLVRDYIKEEVYYREALKLGLDINDTVIRRRLRQKIEFLSGDDFDTLKPSASDLELYFEANQERYRSGAIYDFSQVYFSQSDSTRIAKAQGSLIEGADLNTIGDPIGLPLSMSQVGEDDIVRTFGTSFYQQLNAFEVGKWSGPLISGFGSHLVRITDKQPSRIPKLKEVRQRVLNDWAAYARATSQEDVYLKLRATYDIEIENPNG